MDQNAVKINMGIWDGNSVSHAPKDAAFKHKEHPFTAASRQHFLFYSWESNSLRWKRWLPQGLIAIY